MTQVLFFSTVNNGRGMHVDFSIMSKEQLIKEVEKGNYHQELRYGFVGGSALNIKFMSFNDFEKIFNEDDVKKLGEKFIDNYFVKEIKEKYGTIKDLFTLKRIPKKDLEVGRRYLTDKGEKMFYFGKVDYCDEGSRYGKRDLKEFMFSTAEGKSLEEVLISEYNKSFYCRGNFRKTLPKFVQRLDEKVEVGKTFTKSAEWEDSYYRTIRKNHINLKIVFLDVKEEL